jgi:pSer/pThr/pTyr-binding forkhead associated (FHA) protein
MACVTDTRVSDETTHTRPVILEAGPKFATPDGKHVSITAGSGTLGRKDFRSLLGPEKAALVSREHIRLDYEDGQYYIEDCGSTNGTRLNGTSIRGKGRQPLKDGDEVELANALTLTFKT